MTRIELKSKVGPDGVLDLKVALGANGANREVLVTVEPDPDAPVDDADGRQWRAFVERTYGSCAGLGLEEPDDLPLQPRDRLP